MDWHEGYVDGIDYLADYFREQSPAHLNFACALAGVEPLPLERAFTAFELGCGQGLTSAILAASNPHGRFYAADFNPAQITAAQALAGQARLDNVQWLENSFAELAAGAVALPPLDFITMHGVYSWVNQENRRHIVRFIQRYLKPGGVVYVSYNALPGCSGILPLQRLLLEHTSLQAGGPSRQLAQAARHVAQLREAGAAYFADNDSAALRRHLKGLQESTPESHRYQAHEYLNRGWDALYHADVARDLADARLEYVSSADLCWSLPERYLTPPQRALLEEQTLPALRETVRDVLMNTAFRRDIFVRGTRRMHPLRQADWLGRCRLALSAVREHAVLSLNLPIGAVELEAALFDPMLDALAEGPRSLNELAQLPALRGKSMLEVARLASLLIDSEQVSVCPPPAAAGDGGAAAGRLNAVLARHACEDSRYRALAAPLLGGGVKTPLLQRLVHGALHALGAGAEADQLAAHVCRSLAQQEQAVQRDGCEPASADERRREVDTAVRAILALRLPVWRQLGVLTTNHKGT
ncbi:class I SAM-dependent methyltransferase [Massilia sp. NR 4-1]|uniref:class I SAM-dependent methyltransferase n=1 Tax=Massilia sp. NR 4-1 TaxID=1678028 RepID=UPI00067BFE50|nr:class I SAM-dependent methyltransferase [Massilia sp. NR 4-1]AKU22913.1 hypothetical protein ACZ75_17045 [Massilia sp. NR 4-1]